MRCFVDVCLLGLNWMCSFLSSNRFLSFRNWDGPGSWITNKFHLSFVAPSTWLSHTGNSFSLQRSIVRKCVKDYCIIIRVLYPRSAFRRMTRRSRWLRGVFACTRTRGRSQRTKDRERKEEKEYNVSMDVAGTLPVLDAAVGDLRPTSRGSRVSTSVVTVDRKWAGAERPPRKGRKSMQNNGPQLRIFVGFWVFFFFLRTEIVFEFECFPEWEKNLFISAADKCAISKISTNRKMVTAAAGGSQRKLRGGGTRTRRGGGRG